MYKDVYVGLVKSEKFDYDKPGDPNNYMPTAAHESLSIRNMPSLYGDERLFWDILNNPNAKQVDWGCYVVKMTGEEMIRYVSKRTSRAFAAYVNEKIREHLDLKQEYLLAAVES